MHAARRMQSKYERCPDLRNRSSSDSPRSRPRSGGRREQEPRTGCRPKRILLVTSDTHLLTTLTRRLCTLGHRVCTVTAEGEAPTRWAPRLYDLVVFSASDAPAGFNTICQAARKVDSHLRVVMLTRKPFGAASQIADAVIGEGGEPAMAEKLLALVNSSLSEVA